MAIVRYLVKDVEIASQFYVEALGFELQRAFGSAMAIVEKDSLNLWLAGPLSSAAQITSSGLRPEAGSGWNRIVIEVDDLPKTIEQLRNRNTKFRTEVINGPGGSQILCEDPSGNLIELFQAN